VVGNSSKNAILPPTFGRGSHLLPKTPHIPAKPNARKKTMSDMVIEMNLLISAQKSEGVNPLTEYQTSPDKRTPSESDIE
jgi:hypothetical protein